MNFIEKTENFYEKSRKLLKDYDILYKRTIEFASEMECLCVPTDFESIQHYEEWLRAFKKINDSDKEIVKIVRLLTALKYVETPNDKQIVSDLEENIQLNQISSTHTK